MKKFSEKVVEGFGDFLDRNKEYIESDLRDQEHLRNLLREALYFLPDYRDCHPNDRHQVEGLTMVKNRLEAEFYG